jgi:1-acyl-sn-glycerol-3-phosphate acyltransferase
MSVLRKLTRALPLAFPLGIIALHRMGAPAAWGAGIGAIGIAAHLRGGDRRLVSIQIALISAVVLPVLLIRPENLVRLYPFVLSASVFAIFLLSWRSERPALLQYAGWFRPLTPEVENYLRRMMPLWIAGLGLNTLVFLVFLFHFPIETWAWYAGFFSYLLLAGLFALTLIPRLWQTWNHRASTEVNPLVHAGKMVFGFAVYGMACLTLCIAVPTVWLFSLGQQKVFRRRCRWLSHKAFKACVDYARWCGVIDIQLISDGNHRAARLIVCNHISMFDIVTILAYFPQCTTFVKHKFYRNPFLWPMISACGYLPIDERDPGSRSKAMQRALMELRSGGQVVVFPEGTRSKNGEVGTFQNGVFRLALAAGVPVTPIVFSSDAPFLNSRRDSHQARRTIHMQARVMPAIEPLDATDSRASAVQYRDLVHHKFVEWRQQIMLSSAIVAQLEAGEA